MPDQFLNIFKDEPEQWSLRGDPYLWREMCQALANSGVFPKTVSDFSRQIETTFEKLTGKKLQNEDPIFVKRYSQGGMSSGQVDPSFWRKTAVPLLLSRFPRQL